MVKRKSLKANISLGEDRLLAWDTGIELAHGRIVLVHFLAELINFLRDHLVRMLLVSEHHLHEVKLALNKTTRADIRVNVCSLTSFDTTADGLQSLFEIATFLALSPTHLTSAVGI